eukprot:gene10197-1841_t
MRVTVVLLLVVSTHEAHDCPGASTATPVHVSSGGLPSSTCGDASSPCPSVSAALLSKLFQSSHSVALMLGRGTYDLPTVHAPIPAKSALSVTGQGASSTSLRLGGPLTVSSVQTCIQGVSISPVPEYPGPCVIASPGEDSAGPLHSRAAVPFSEAAAALLIQDCLFDRCQDGAVRSRAGIRAVSVLSSVFTNNSATSDYGGGGALAVQASGVVPTMVDVAKSTFHNNTAFDGGGGGIWAHGPGTDVWVLHSAFSDCVADFNGGAVCTALL